jgi:HAD superfamily hydrolase (TIGR01490 family)
LREDFFAQRVAPRLLGAGRDCIERHRGADHILVLTTATNRFITEPTAQALGIPHLIATECALDAGGRFTGEVAGVLNMRAGKVERLHAWLATQDLALDEIDSVFYSDSINDLPLLAAVRQPVAVDPDVWLAAEAHARGWPVRRWRGG